MGAGVLAFVGGAEMKLTRWYPGDVKPVRVGVYERSYGDNANPGIHVGYAFFDGVDWFLRSRTTEDATTNKLKSAHTRLPWRGLAQDPKGSKK
jgi:hypothetical protein